MIQSLRDQALLDAMAAARTARSAKVQVDGQRVVVPRPYPSPVDWRDTWVYFLMIDRFHNPAAPPRHLPWDAPEGRLQGGTFEGVRRQLGYLQRLGVGALWLSPVLKNCPFDQFAHHGYAIQNFLEVDPRYASDPAHAAAELQALIDEAHARGLYVIFDIVLNHAGDVFEYDGFGATAPWSDTPRPIRWRDADGHGRPDWPQPPVDPPGDATVWPRELQRNELFRRQGKGGEAAGDFESLKEMVTEYQEAGRYPVRDLLIRACQYLVARFDIDGLRIDTLKYIERDFARLFGNALREFCYSIGKENFFTFGEVYDADEAKIAAYIGRNTQDAGDLVGVDAALDFPLFFKLPAVAKGLIAPEAISRLFDTRKAVQRQLLSSHGEAGRYFVTFLDNHDQNERFFFEDPVEPGRYAAQVTVGLACLFGLQGIPCLYYGTEQGLHGRGDRPEYVREALWGRPGVFDATHPFYRAVQQLTALRDQRPSLRFGRQYFRPVSGDGTRFGISPYPGGVLSFSRIVNVEETLVVANTNARDPWTGEVVVDGSLQVSGSGLAVLWSNQPEPVAPAPVRVREAGSVTVSESNGAVTQGPLSVVRISLRPMEVQFVGA